MISIRKVGLTSIPGLVSGVLGIGILCVGIVVELFDTDWKRLFPPSTDWIGSLLWHLANILLLIASSIFLLNKSSDIFTLKFSEDDHVILSIALGAFGIICTMAAITPPSGVSNLFPKAAALASFTAAIILFADKRRYQDSRLEKYISEEIQFNKQSGH